MIHENPVAGEAAAADDLLPPGLLPAAEPVLVPPVPGEGVPGRILAVSETLLDGNELRYLTECIETNWISSLGRFVGEFEEKFAAAAGCRHAIACSSGTAALHLAMAALELGPGDEVILPTFTMVATANAVTYTGATPVLVDAEPETWNLDPAEVAAKITPRTRAIIAVHTYGHPAAMDSLRDLARRHGLALVEDAAEAHGALFQGRPVGSLGDLACFSFYGNKIITTGEGGMVTTNDPALARLARTLRDHAFSPERHFWHHHLGFNYRMTNMQAAVGLAQTERLAEFLTRRREMGRLYTRSLAAVPGLTLPPAAPWAEPVCWMYGLLIEEAFGVSRDALRQHLASRGIETRSFFIPMHLQPIYRQQHRGELYPIAEALCRKGLYLPSALTLTAAEIGYVAQEIARCRLDRA